MASRATPTPPPASPGDARTPAKRKAPSDAGPSGEPRVSRVRFSHVTIRELATEVWGGGGVPADDGPPLGLSWNLQSTRHVNIDEFEDEREQTRTPKDSYCVEGCMEPNMRRQVLLSSGSTPKQIKAATKAVAQLNQDRWKASEVIFGDAWLFRAARTAEPTELLAMLGQPETRGFELVVSNWDCAEACARELAKPLGVTPDSLLLSASEAGDDGDETHSGSGHGSAESEDGIAWSAATAAMQGLSEQIVLIVRCAEGGAAHPMRNAPPGGAVGAAPGGGANLGHALLGRLVGCVANSHIAAQVIHARRGNVSVVLRGWPDDKIEADWSDDDPDELCISPLH